MAKKILKSDFFNRKTALVAEELLGKFLITKMGESEIVLMINEVEVYDGTKDLASHARHGPLKRGKLMFGEPGIWYVYFTYGMHWMLNITTRESGYPAAILIRGVEGIKGPARVTKAYGIDKNLNGIKADKKSGLWIEDRGIVRKNNEYRIKNKEGEEKRYSLIKTPRIGIDHSGPFWKNKKLRFLLK